MGSKQRKSNKKPYRTDWDPIAAWYDGWVGEAGSKHHRLLAIPTVLELAQVESGENVLDIGAGQGVLCPYITKAGGNYWGVDLSPRMIQNAKKRFGKQGKFYIGDAMALSEIPELPVAFELVVFLLSLQDLDPLDQAVRVASSVVKPGGRIVILMTHPSFRIPRQSGWGWDEGRKLRYRRIDSYLSQLAVPLKTYPGEKKGSTRSFHRPLQDYVNALGENSCYIDQLVEVPTYKEERASENSRAVNRANREIPLFLGLRAIKIKE